MSWLLFLTGCVDSLPDTAQPDPNTETDTDEAEACAYPDGAVEPMAVGEVLSPYQWPARRLDGTRATIDLADVPCASSEEIDWSPFDYLVFVSLPAW